MNLIFRDQPHAQFLALGVSRVVSHPVWVEPGSRVVLAATEEPVDAFTLRAVISASVDAWNSWGAAGYIDVDEDGNAHVLPAPLGVVVGTAVVARCHEIAEVEDSFLVTFREKASIALPSGRWHDITDEVAFDPEGFRPGRWALMLDDAKPVSARCPRCFVADPTWSECQRSAVRSVEADAAVATIANAAMRQFCGLCSGSGVVDDPGASGLANGEWT